LFLGNATLGLGLEKTSYLYFFFKCWLGWTSSIWFGSIGFRLWKPNRTGTFLWFFHRLIRFFLGLVFSVIVFRFSRFNRFFCSLLVCCVFRICDSSYGLKYFLFKNILKYFLFFKIIFYISTSKWFKNILIKYFLKIERMRFSQIDP